MNNQFCTNCGKPLIEGDKFCGNCSAQVMQQGVPQYQQPIQQPQQHGQQYAQPQNQHTQEYVQPSQPQAPQHQQPSQYQQPLQYQQPTTPQQHAQQYQQPQQYQPHPQTQYNAYGTAQKKKSKAPLIVLICVGVVVLLASAAWVLGLFSGITGNHLAEFNEMLDEIRALEDFHIYRTHVSFDYDSESDFRITTSVYTSNTLNEQRTITTFDGDDRDPFVLRNVYIDGIEYWVSTPFFSMPDVMIYEQSSTRRMEEFDLSIDAQLTLPILEISERTLERFLTSHDGVLAVSLRGSDVFDFIYELNEEGDGAYAIFLQSLGDVDMTEAYHITTLEKYGDAFRIFQNAYFPELSRSESVIYVTSWDPEPIVPFLWEYFDMSLIDDELEAQLRDEYFADLDLLDIDESMERWRVQGGWYDFTGFNFRSELLSFDLELLRSVNHPPRVDFASWYLRDHELTLNHFHDLQIDVPNVNSINIEYRTMRHIHYADEAILEMMNEIDDNLYVDLLGFYFVNASEERDFAKVVVLRWSVVDDGPKAFLFASQSDGREMFALSIELYLNRLVESDVQFLRDLQDEIWPNMLRDIYQQMDWSDLNLEEQLENMR